MAHITPLSQRLRYFCSRKIVRAGDKGQLQRNNIFKTQKGSCMNELISVWQAQGRQNPSMGGGGHEIPPLAEVLLAFKRFWERMSHGVFFCFALLHFMVWPMGGLPHYRAGLILKVVGKHKLESLGKEEFNAGYVGASELRMWICRSWGRGKYDENTLYQFLKELIK